MFSYCGTYYSTKIMIFAIAKYVYIELFHTWSLKRD